VGEVWSGTDEVLPYIGDEVDLAFEFRLAGAMLQSARREDSAPVREALRDVCARYPPQQWATVLTNHDQDRTMTALAGSVNHARTAASLLLTSPGVPFLYYGEEIGQQGGKPDENIRSPMQWSGGPRAGFTTGTPWRAPQADADLVNVEAQRMRVGSLWSHYRDLIDLRNRHAALRRGAWGGVPASDDRLYACLRWTADDAVLVLINLGDEALSGYRLSPATSELRPSLVGVDLPSLSPYETVVIPLPSPEE
jgi:glycosidase